MVASHQQPKCDYGLYHKQTPQSPIWAQPDGGPTGPAYTLPVRRNYAFEVQTLNVCVVLTVIATLLFLLPKSWPNYFSTWHSFSRETLMPFCFRPIINSSPRFYSIPTSRRPYGLFYERNKRDFTSLQRLWRYPTTTGNWNTVWGNGIILLRLVQSYNHQYSSRRCPKLVS